jgi:hypothetical protein
VSFLGAGSPNRTAALTGLAVQWKRKGLPPAGFRIFGPGFDSWDMDLSPHIFEHGRDLSLEESVLACQGSKVNVNIHLGHSKAYNPGSLYVNARTFQLAASRAFQITDPRPMMNDLFSKDEVFQSNAPEALPEEVFSWLGRPEETEAMAEASMRRALSSHTYTHRLQAMLEAAFPEG